LGLQKLEEEPRPRGAKKLQAEDVYRLRDGNSHVIIFVIEASKCLFGYLSWYQFELIRLSITK
jgi:hypothetical protein